MAGADWARVLVEGAEALGISLRRASLDLFARYMELLLRFNRRFNLTAATEPEEIAVKHFLDSLTCLPALGLSPAGSPESKAGSAQRTLIDVGSGAGFPGIPIAIACPRMRVTLLDSATKKCQFTEMVAGELGLENVSIVSARAETFAHDEGARENFDIAVSRAVASLPVLTEYCLPFLRIGGMFLAMKGPKGASEIEQARRAFEALGGRFDSARGFSLPHGAGERVLVSVRKAAPTPPKYPRRTGVPAKRPL